MRLWIALSCLFAACHSAKPAKEPLPPLPVIKEYDQLKKYVGKTITLEGTLLMEPFVDKGGRTHEDIQELWLEMNDQHRVKLRNIGEALSKEPFTHRVYIRGTLFYGNIDSDQPEAQSRVGYRLDFDRITMLSE